MKPTRIIEICANSAQSCVEAEAGGAKRVELCAGIPEGGTTPSYGEIRTAQALTSSIDINVIIRPRGGRLPLCTGRGSVDVAGYRTVQAVEGARRSLWLPDERRGYRRPFDAPSDRGSQAAVCHLSPGF